MTAFLFCTSANHIRERTIWQKAFLAEDVVVTNVPARREQGNDLTRRCPIFHFSDNANPAILDCKSRILAKSRKS